MASIMERGASFKSYIEFENCLKEFKMKSYSEFFIADCRTLEAAKKRYPNRVANACPDLKYYFLKLMCVHGGTFKKKKDNLGQRKTSSMRQGCTAFIYVKLSDDGTQLVISDMSNEHNHEVSKELFSSLPSQRSLAPDVQQKILELLEMEANKKLVLEKFTKLTQKKITLRDLSNIKVRGASNTVRVQVAPNQDRLSTEQKFQKAAGVTNKLNVLISESSKYQPKIDLLSQLYGLWAEGKEVELTVKNVSCSQAAAAQAPDAEGTQSPDADKTQSPDADKTQFPDANKTQSPDADKTQSPDADKTQSPVAEGTQSLAANEIQSPDAGETLSPAAEEKLSADTEETLSLATEETQCTGSAKLEAHFDDTTVGRTVTVRPVKRKIEEYLKIKMRKKLAKISQRSSNQMAKKGESDRKKNQFAFQASLIRQV
ncbi:uncharacterized protein LOC129227597 [Uloborus diversus]|uniref:uncharacterized protein LOC129227597 n=1 Tax=Uloborus diversus TaxID=327109 RepID=UPI00240A98F5|nr:uncharacterized protein LOC129227597 [Uloborus diversus]